MEAEEQTQEGQEMLNRKRLAQITTNKISCQISSTPFEVLNTARRVPLYLVWSVIPTSFKLQTKVKADLLSLPQQPKR